jgi:hypothetical protein
MNNKWWVTISMILLCAAFVMSYIVAYKIGYATAKIEAVESILELYQQPKEESLP